MKQPPRRRADRTGSRDTGVRTKCSATLIFKRDGLREELQWRRENCNLEIQTQSDNIDSVGILGGCAILRQMCQPARQAA
jgi:hypothetical protein